MTVERIIMNRLIDENTEIYIRSNTFKVLTHGKWYNDNVLRYLDSRVESFSLKDDNNLYIDIK